MRDLKVALSAAIYKAVAGKAKNLVNTWRRAYLLDPVPLTADGALPDLSMSDGGAVMRCRIERCT